jgi:endo-1,4-beta-xylanase
MKINQHKNKRLLVTAGVCFILFVCSPYSNAQKFLGNIYQNSTPAYFTQFWDQVSPENSGKWGSCEPNRDSYNWSGHDNAYNFANQNGYPFKGHTLVWGAQEPGWIGSLSQSEQRAEVEEWIRDFFQRYPGVDYIDVVNEPLHQPASYRNALGGSGATGWDWVITAFQLARQYAPGGCKLLINEYGIISNPTEANNYVTIINLLKNRGLIDGIGIQCHAFNMDNVTTATMTQVLNILAATGLPIYVSELDIRGDDNTQLQRYQQKFPIFWNHASVQGVTLWGYLQGSMWQPEAWLVASNGSQRPAMQWLMNYVSASDPGGDESVWLEAECGTVGSLWNVVSDGNASNDQYVTIQSGNNSTSGAPSGTNGQIAYNFNVSESGNYTVWARVITPNGNDDSFWLRMDGGSWFAWNNIGPNSSWAWEQSQTYSLSAGSHTFTVGYREDGSRLDKIYITNTGSTPSGEGSAAGNCGTSSGDYSITVRARGTNGSEQIRLSVGGTAVQTWTLGTSMNNYNATTSLSGNIRVEFINDDGTVRDVQVDYIQVEGTTSQAENQAVNTGVWQNSSCGGQNSEWLHCGGYIEFSAYKNAHESIENSSLSSGESMFIYPNPASDILNISLPQLGEEGAILSIYSLNGRLAGTFKLGNEDSSISLDMIQPGLYMLKLNYNNQLVTRKFIKN